MSDVPEQSFEVEPSFSRLSKISIWIFAAMAIAFAAVPIVQENPLEPSRQDAAFALTGLIFAALGIWAYKISVELPLAAISLDSDGLWRTIVGKRTGLITWDRIYSVRERPLLQRLELLDRIGNVLIKLEYQLSNFELARRFVLDQLPNSYRLDVLPVTFSKPAVYHVVTIAITVAFVALGAYAGLSNPLLGYGGVGIVVLLCITEYLGKVYEIRVERSHLDLAYPLRRVRLHPSDISDVGVSDQFHKGVRLPEVVLVVRGRNKGISLSDLGPDTLTLCLLLKSWQAREPSAAGAAGG